MGGLKEFSLLGCSNIFGDTKTEVNANAIEILREAENKNVDI